MIKAAEYVRMSTDQQKYSTANQSALIRSYAESRGMEIVTFSSRGYFTKPNFSKASRTCSSVHSTSLATEGTWITETFIDSG